MANELEREFRVDELFFSITDKNGKIKAGNEVFARISGYSMSELLNKPHSIIRHADMPRAVFRVLWDYIQAGRTVAAYVKNRAKDGKYYWVLAFVANTPEGYLSVRFKPTTDTLNVVDSLYSKLREIERRVESEPGKTKDDAIQASLEALMQELKALGFTDYDDFIERALVSEFSNRRSLLTQLIAVASSDPLSELLTKISDQLDEILKKQAEFSKLERSIASAIEYTSALTIGVQRASLNMTIKSENSSVAAAPISVVSDWLKTGSVELGRDLDAATLPIKGELRKLQGGFYNLATSKLQVEMVLFFLQEMRAFDTEKRGYDDDTGKMLMKLLAGSARENFLGSAQRLTNLASAIRNVSYSFHDIQRNVLGLGLAHINGRVECARLPDGEAIEVILNEVMQSIVDAKSRLIALEECFESMESLMRNFTESTTSLVGLYNKLNAEIRE